MAREVKPFPFDLWTNVKLRYFGKTPQDFTELDFNYMPREAKRQHDTNLQISTPGVYRAIYKTDGTLSELNVSGEEGPFFSFNFRKGTIVDSDDVSLGIISEHLNTERRLIFNDRFYTLTQSATQTIARVVNPVKNKEILTVSVPSQTYSMENMVQILSGDSNEWLRLHEYLPVKISKTE